MPDSKNPHGDDQGTRIGAPDTGTPSSRNQSRGSTGAGSEAAEGIHSADGGRDPSERSALESQQTGWGDVQSSPERGSRREGSDQHERSGSEPLVGRETEHRSGYGGSAGKPVSSSDQRAPTSEPGPSRSETGDV
jgi:hypothetical protein